jgi:hypothetical protein
MLLLDAAIAIAQSDAPDAWERYCQIAPRVLPEVDAADAPREVLRRARLSGYDSTLRWVDGGPEVYEAHELENIFLERFVDAVRGGSFPLYGVPQGGTAVTPIPAVLITVDAFKDVRGGGREWKLAGTMWHAIDVVMGPPPGPELPPLRDATDDEVHAAIDAEYTACEQAGRPGWNLKEIRKPVQNRLRAKGLYATQDRIQQLAADKRYTGRRDPPGKKRSPLISSTHSS